MLNRESFGNYTFGNDEVLMPHITSANIAGGFHAGDPRVLRETVALADEHDVGVGIHPGLPDKLGFGRRTMDAPPEEIRDYVVYQLGALTAFAEAQDVEVQHVKIHGALYTMLSQSDDHTRAVIEGILSVDPDLIFIAHDHNMYRVAQEYDELDAVPEGYVDLEYNPDGTFIVEREKEYKDPDVVAERFVNMVVHDQVEATNGEMVDVPAETICIHGDGPNPVELLEAIHERIENEPIDLVRLEELV